MTCFCCCCQIDKSDGPESEHKEVKTKKYLSRAHDDDNQRERAREGWGHFLYPCHHSRGAFFMLHHFIVLWSYCCCCCFICFSAKVGRQSSAIDFKTLMSWFTYIFRRRNLFSFSVNLFPKTPWFFIKKSCKDKLLKFMDCSFTFFFISLIRKLEN